MRNILLTLFLQMFFSLAAQAQDQQLFADLNLLASEVSELALKCENLSKTDFKKLYLGRMQSCHDELLTQKFNLLIQSVSMIAQSGFDEEPEEVFRLHPLVIQILFEEMSELSLDKVVKQGGSSGLGLCLGFVSIGICKSTPETLKPSLPSDKARRFLRFLGSLEPEGSKCNWGLWPSAAIKMMLELLALQTPSQIQTNDQGNVFLMNMGPREPSYIQLVLRYKSQTAMRECPQGDLPHNALQFFQELKAR